jgi:uncharacterized membrane protein
MNQLLLALVAFVGTHLLMSHPLRAPMVRALGEKGFSIAYSLVSFATLYWVYAAFVAAPRGIDMWPAGEAAWAIGSALMLLGSILFAGSLVGNPALPAPGAAQAAAKPARGVFAITRHPMMWGFTLWAIVHAMLASYLDNIALTFAIGFLALVGAAGQDHKKARLMGDGWKDWQNRTSFLPFGGQLSGRIPWAAAWPGRTAILLGILIWLGASWAHPLLGGPLVGLWRYM